MVEHSVRVLESAEGVLENTTRVLEPDPGKGGDDLSKATKKVKDKVPETPFEFQTSEGVKGNGANDKSYMDSLLTTGLYQGHGGQDLNLEKKMTWWRIMGRKRMLENRFLTLVRLFKYLMRSLHSSVHLGRGHWWFMC